ncbi:MAG: hypothetical protein MUE41_08595, partial [Gemmatimonadaceae bacterium]|nr:hypothetical protein [Gemmatimonadaceae bacterium]
PLQATALRLGARASDSARVRIDRVEGAAIDSAFVSAGGVQLLWPARTTTDSATGALVRGVVVAAPLARRTVDTTARAIGWFADGRVAVTERAIGTGCVRDVGVLVPTAGDLAITPRFVALLDALRAPCGDGTDLTPITTEERRALITAPAATVAPALAALPSTGDTRLMRALLGAAAALLLLELPLRQRRATA